MNTRRTIVLLLSITWLPILQYSDAVAVGPVAVAGGKDGSVLAWALPDGGAIEIVRFGKESVSSRVTQTTSKVTVGTADEVVSIALDEDVAGRLFVAWQTVHSQNGVPGSYTVRAQAIGADGTALWGPVVVMADASDGAPSVVADGKGGALAAFDVGEAHSLAEDAVEVRHITSDGSVEWSRQFAAERARFFRPRLVTSGDGGAIVVFEAQLTGGPTESVRHIFAQRLNAEGQTVWGQNDAPVALAATNFDEHSPVLIADGGGVIAVFESVVPSGVYAGNRNIAAQRIGPDGRMLWGKDGVPLWVSATTADEQAPASIPDGEGGAIVAFEGRSRALSGDSTSDIWAQRISGSGQLFWGRDGFPATIAATDAREVSPHLALTADRNIVVAYAGESSAYVDIISPSGASLWARATTLGSSSDGSLVHPWANAARGADLLIVEKTSGAARFTYWTVDANGQAINRTAYPTAVNDSQAPSNAIRLTVAPNPFNSTTAIGFWADGHGRSDIRIFDALGQRVRTISYVAGVAGWQQVRWDARSDAGDDVASGTYLFIVDTDHRGGGQTARRLSGRLTLVR